MIWTVCKEEKIDKNGNTPMKNIQNKYSQYNSFYFDNIFPVIVIY
jgi:hypothetical protein